MSEVSLRIECPGNSGEYGTLSCLPYALLNTLKSFTSQRSATTYNRPLLSVLVRTTTYSFAHQNVFNLVLYMLQV